MEHRNFYSDLTIRVPVDHFSRIPRLARRGLAVDFQTNLSTWLILPLTSMLIGPYLRCRHPPSIVLATTQIFFTNSDFKLIAPNESILQSMS
ncbi:hypothetical protein LMG33810_000694 [Carnimonas sp. LMG 33810]